MKLVMTIEIPGGRGRSYQRTVATIMQMMALQMLSEPMPEHGDVQYGDAKMHYHVTFGEE